MRRQGYYRWLWHGYADDVMEARPELKLNGKDLIQFRFSGSCLVTVDLNRKQWLPDGARCYGPSTIDCKHFCRPL